MDQRKILKMLIYETLFCSSKQCKAGTSFLLHPFYPSVTDNLYTSTGWYPAVLTSPDKKPTLGDQKNEMGRFNQNF